jgi:hypothetical protein
MSDPFCCPHCKRPWDETSAAFRRMQRIVDNEVRVEDALDAPGFIADLRLVLAATERVSTTQDPRS